MAKKKEGKQISNRLLYSLITLGVLVILAIGVYAVAPKTGTVTSTTIEGQWITSGNNIYYNNGNVGIGTSSPTEKLQVKGNIKFGTTSQATMKLVVGSSCPPGTVEIARKWAPKACSSCVINSGNCTASCTTTSEWKSVAPTCTFTSGPAIVTCKATTASEVVCIGV